MRKRCKGLSLIEAAIVLGVVGLVIGGIWVAASSVMANTRRNEITATIHNLRQRVIEVWYGQPMIEDVPGGGYLRMTRVLYPSEEIVALSAVADPIKSYWNTLSPVTTYLHKSASGLYSSADARPALKIIGYSFGPVSRADCVWVGMNITKLITLTDGGYGNVFSDAYLNIMNSAGLSSLFFGTDGYHIGDTMNSYVKTNCADGINIMGISMGTPR